MSLFDQRKTQWTKKEGRMRVLLWFVLAITVAVAPIVLAVSTKHCPIQPWAQDGSARIIVEPEDRLERIADVLLVPLMYVVSGTLKEEPQRTHYWNTCSVPATATALLDPGRMQSFKGIPGAERWLIHITILGGWSNYVVLAPTDSDTTWYVGWTGTGYAGVSRIPIRGPVRVLVGDADVSFFGVQDRNGAQISLKHVGSGKIGEGGPYANIPLL